MSVHIAFLLRGLGSGGVYAALAMALVVTYRSSGVVNLATGAMALYTAETYSYLRDGLLVVPFPGLPSTIGLVDGAGDGGSVDFIPAVVISLVIAAALGVLLHYMVFRPLRSAPAVAKAVASVGVMIVIQALLAIRLGTGAIITAPILPSENVDILGQPIRLEVLWFAAIVVALAVVLSLMFRYTRFGLTTQAVAETEKGAMATGLRPDRIARANWALSSVVAGIAGILISPIVPIIPYSYTLFIVPALAAALVGNFAKLGPAVAAGLAIGALQSELVNLQFTYTWLPQAGLPELVPLVLVLVVLVIRGRPLPMRGTLVLRTLGRAPRTRNLPLSTAIGVAVGVGALMFSDGAYRAALILTLIYAVISLSWVVVTGFAGQISLAQLALAGVGAFSLHRFAENWGVPFPIAPLLSAGIATVIGVVVGLPALRIRGLPVAVVTLTLAVAVEAIWFRNTHFNGGLNGAPINPPKLFGMVIHNDAKSGRLAFGILCLVTLALVGVAVAWLRTSRLGAAMLAVKANERSAAASGINVARTKLVAFGIGAYIAGLGGALLAYQQGAAIPASYNATLGLGVFATAYLAGMTSVFGGILAGVLASGGIVFVLLDRHFDMGEWYDVAAGVLLVVSIIKSPEGIAGTVTDLLARFRRRTLADPVLPTFEHRSPAVTTPAPDEGRVLLSLNNVGVTYGGVVAVDGVSFDVCAGHIVGLIGPNGAGKTTLIDAISGFTVSSGTVMFDGASVDGLPPHQRVRRGLGRTFQGVELYEDLTVEENVVVGTAAARSGRQGAPRGGIGSDLDAVFELLQLSAVRDRQVKELSAGYRQLVSVARALAGQPAMVLLDEPAGGLSSDESQWLGDRLRDVRDAGVTVLMIDHDMSLVLGVCDRIHVLDLGRIIASGPPAAIETDPVVTAAYLGSAHVPQESIA
jgi:ABC-type branched-subunit amino acid transport system ATPase component/branched-subunit amino acid ABC-type transport system permease component